MEAETEITTLQVYKADLAKYNAARKIDERPGIRVSSPAYFRELLREALAKKRKDPATKRALEG